MGQLRAAHRRAHARRTTSAAKLLRLLLLLQPSRWVGRRSPAAAAAAAATPLRLLLCLRGSAGCSRQLQSHDSRHVLLPGIHDRTTAGASGSSCCTSGNRQAAATAAGNAAVIHTGIRHLLFLRLDAPRLAIPIGAAADSLAGRTIPLPSRPGLLQRLLLHLAPGAAAATPQPLPPGW